MRKMTDNEITKALECCLLSTSCVSCPLIREKNNCTSILIENSFTLINKQKTKIEELQQNLMEAHIDIEEHLEKIERLKDNIDDLDCKLSMADDCIAEKQSEIIALRKKSLKSKTYKFVKTPNNPKSYLYYYGFSRRRNIKIL